MAKRASLYEQKMTTSPKLVDLLTQAAAHARLNKAAVCCDFEALETDLVASNHERCHRVINYLSGIAYSWTCAAFNSLSDTKAVHCCTLER